MKTNGDLLSTQCWSGESSRRSELPLSTHDSPVQLRERIAKIEILLLDVDGVMTDGGIFYGDGGGEWKRFHVRDGVGLKLWRKAGKRAGIITGRRSPAAAA